jgi:hypothetical protein
MGPIRRLFGRPAGDPGEAWARRALEPLRRETADCDISPAVMARVAALPAPRPAPAGSRRARWLVAAAAAGMVLLSAGLAATVLGEEGFAREAWALLSFGGRLLVAAGASLLAVASRALVVAGAMFRPVLILIEVAAPLLRGAGLAAAAFGALSILFSLSAFAHALRTAPSRSLKGGTR